MTNSPPEVVQREPGRSYYDTCRLFFNEVKTRLEAPVAAVTSLGAGCTGVDLTLSGALTAASVKTAEGDIRHGDVTLIIPAIAGHFSGAPGAGSLTVTTTTGNRAAVIAGSSSGLWFVPIALKTGDRIKSIVGNVISNGAATVSMKAMKATGSAGNGAGTQLGSTQSTTSATDAALTVSGLTEVVASGTWYWAEFALPVVAASRPCVGWIEVTYDRP